MSYLDRVLADKSIDEAAWRAARRNVIGASDAAKFSKAASVPLYLAGKLNDSAFHGNSFTESGNRWEPMMLAWAGIPASGALIHHPDERGFGATPDGITPDGKRLAECKAKHDRIILGPTLGEWRQVAWQFFCVPEAEELEWIWAELLGGRLVQQEPKSITIPRDHPKVIELTARIRPIATEVLAALLAAREFEQEMRSA